MNLAALTIGAGAPEGDFVGRVEEVYTNACLCALSNAGWLTLLTVKVGTQPCAVVVDAPMEFSFRRTLTAGAPVAARAGVLRAGDQLAIDLRQARPWRCRLTDLKLDLRTAPTARAWRAASEALRRDGRETRLQQIAGIVVDELSLATSCCDLASARRAMARLIGLGEGRTPAGDDFLVGYFAGLWACADAARMDFVAALAARLKALSTQTNQVSRLYLEAAAEGQVSERLYAVAVAIAEGIEDAALTNAVAAALAVGHSSGAAGVYGLLRSCAVWTSDAAAALL